MSQLENQLIKHIATIDEVLHEHAKTHGDETDFARTPFYTSVFAYAVAISVPLKHDDSNDEPTFPSGLNLTSASNKINECVVIDLDVFDKICHTVLMQRTEIAHGNRFSNALFVAPELEYYTNYPALQPSLTIVFGNKVLTHIFAEMMSLIAGTDGESNA